MLASWVLTMNEGFRMLDDHKYSLKRKVAYSHPSPAYSDEAYGPGGPGRTTGAVGEVHLVDGEGAHWEYTLVNSFTSEVCRVAEEDIFHGANMAYLDIHRRDGIQWSAPPPETAGDDPESDFWQSTLKDFVRKAVPKIRERELDEERERSEGRNLSIGEGDYIKVRGDVRPEMEACHNLYAKVQGVSPSGIHHLDVPDGRQGIAEGEHRVLNSYHVRLDNGIEADIYDVEVKAVYTTNSRRVVLNWRAATFLAEAFGDDPPYELQLEYLNGHVFTRSELEGMSAADMGELLGQMLYAKGMITWEEVHSKTENLVYSPSEYLVDQLLAISRFDMVRNQSMASNEIERLRAEDSRLRELFSSEG